MMIQQKYTGFFLKFIQFFLATIIFAFVGIIFSLPFLQMEASEIFVLKITQLIQSICMFTLPPLFVAYIWTNKPFEYLHLKNNIRWRDILSVSLFMLLAIPFINLLGYLNEQIVLPDFLSGIENWMMQKEIRAEELTLRMLSVETLPALLFTVFLIAVVPAFGEEIFFRACLQNIISEKNHRYVLTIWIVAVVFSAIHLQFYGFFPRMLLGAFFGYLLFWSGNLWLSITAHFINNAAIVVFYFLYHNQFICFDIDSLGTQETWYIGIISGVISIFGIVALKKKISA